MHPYRQMQLLPIDSRRLMQPASEGKSTRGAAFSGKSLIEILRFRAAMQPDDFAFTFLDDGEIHGATLTYRELDLRSRSIAVLLQERIQPGARVLLLYQPGLEFITAFFGCLYAGVVAVPVPVPNFRRSNRSNASMNRLLAIAADAGSSAVLSTSEIFKRLDGTNPLLHREWIATDVISNDASAAWLDPRADQQTLAFLQYTSGSTAAPKGVMISHGNLLHNLASGFQFAGNDASTISVSWLPMTHDMGLIDGVLQPVYSGSPAYLMSPAAFLQRPVRWLRAISRYRASRSGAPNFAYELCARKITPEDCHGLDLSSWRIAYNGAEPVRQETLDMFTSIFAAYGFRSSALRPCYGLAEATLFVSGKSGTDSDLLSSFPAAVSCGRPTPEMRVRVVHPESLQLCQPGETGEIWIAGPSIASGYWNRSEQTTRTFHAYTADGQGPFLRTGDLGFGHAGELYVTGRCKDVLIVRGAKHYPQDIEHTAERQHPAIRPGGVAVFSCGVNSSVDLIALMAEIDARRMVPDFAQVITADIRRAVAESHGVQLHAVILVGPGAIPRTTSGKLQRFACREIFLSQDFSALAEWREPLSGTTGLSVPVQHVPDHPLSQRTSAECL